ncbi:hypothetical protein BD289DRAFT_238494 [Coniella lustricola]|uniref:Secreted protein n=1 Tax=Coniella lustricola TaxID=2025994 RepID=A0A2T3AL63_9PEZI|nr:hypothetical protein BD289DRAFT_238494 [Coniella lustricola]
MLFWSLQLLFLCCLCLLLLTASSDFSNLASTRPLDLRSTLRESKEALQVLRTCVQRIRRARTQGYPVHSNNATPPSVKVWIVNRVPIVGRDSNTEHLLSMIRRLTFWAACTYRCRRCF